MMMTFRRSLTFASVLFLATHVWIVAVTRVHAQEVKHVGYYVIGATPGKTDWQHFGSFDDLESAKEEMKKQANAGKTCTVWIITITGAPQPGCRPIYKGKAFVNYQYFDYRDGELRSGTPNVFKFQKRDEIIRSIDPGSPQTTIERLQSLTGEGHVSPGDKDADGLNDGLEDQLAARFAPIVFHEKDEPNLPTNVDWFLKRTTLRFKVESLGIDELVKNHPTQADLCYVRRKANGPRARPPRRLRPLLRRQLVWVDSCDCCDRKKQFTFYLTDVSDADKRGSPNQEDWTTYTHVYSNTLGGVTIQYWRFYAFNTGKDVGITRLGSHGGDWEGIHVILDGNHNPVEVALLGHTDITIRPWAAMHREGTHPKIYAGWGSHSSKSTGGEDGFRHETWKTGKLLNVGERVHPINGQSFIRYSGLWGSPGTFTWTSGYWGPAFNETGEKGGFVTAWCRGMRQRRAMKDECSCGQSLPDGVRGRL